MRHFTLAQRAARDQQVRDVDAADEQHEPRGGEQHEQRPANLPHELVAHR